MESVGKSFAPQTLFVQNFHVLSAVKGLDDLPWQMSDKRELSYRSFHFANLLSNDFCR